METIFDKLRRAYEIAMESENYEQAIAICDQVIRDHPTLPDGVRERAAIYARMGDYSRAITDIDAAITLDPTEPDYHFFRGWWHLVIGNFDEAVEAETTAIEVGNKKSGHPFRESAHFFRAVAFSQQGKFEEVLSDCEMVRDDYLIYLDEYGKLTKAELVERAIAATKRE